MLRKGKKKIEKDKVREQIEDTAHLMNELKATGISRIAMNLEKEGKEALETAKAMKLLAASRDIFRALESTNVAIKGEIEKNRERLAKGKKEIEVLEKKIEEEKVLASTEIAAIKEGVVAEKKAALADVNKSKAAYRKGLDEMAAQAKQEEAAFLKMARDANKKAKEAVSKKEAAESELAGLTRELLKFKDSIHVKGG